MEDDLRVNLVACQLISEANEWWESILGIRRDTKRVAMTVAQANEPDVENLTWAEFEEVFEGHQELNTNSSYHNWKPASKAKPKQTQEN